MLLAAAAAMPAAAMSMRLAPLNIDPATVTAAGLGNSADFAHQFHIAYSSMVSGACLFSGQPFNCAVAGFPQDVPHAEPVTPASKAKHGCPGCFNCSDSCTTQSTHPGMSLAFDHCKRFPAVVDVGSLVDYPRRACGQDPIQSQQCFDDVNFLKHSRVFIHRSANDPDDAVGNAENIVALLAQMMAYPAGLLTQGVLGVPQFGTPLWTPWILSR
jgi:hypothetical protein